MTSDRHGEAGFTVSSRRVMDDALSILARKRVSSGQLQLMLRRRGWGENEISVCCDELRKWGYLDDPTYARQIVHDMLQSCPAGRQAALAELNRRLFPRELAIQIVDEVYAELDERELAKAAATRYMRARQGLADNKYLQRLARWLWRRGFDSEVISSVLEQVRCATDE